MHCRRGAHTHVSTVSMGTQAATRHRCATHDRLCVLLRRGSKLALGVTPAASTQWTGAGTRQPRQLVNRGSCGRKVRPATLAQNRPPTPAPRHARTCCPRPSRHRPGFAVTQWPCSHGLRAAWREEHRAHARSELPPYPPHGAAYGRTTAPLSLMRVYWCRMTLREATLRSREQVYTCSRHVSLAKAARRVLIIELRSVFAP